MLSKIIYGRKGSDFSKVAPSLIKKALCLKTGEESCDCYSCSLQLSQHSDLIQFLSSSHSVEEIDEIVKFANSNPIISNRKVVYLENLSSVTEVSQNKLLKELEDNKSFVLIATADALVDTVIPTIKSRTETILLEPESKDEFFKMLSDEQKSDADVLYQMTDGYFGLVNSLSEQIDIFKGVEKAFKERDGKLLFSSLNMVADKDKSAYPEKYCEDLPSLFSFMSKLALLEEPNDAVLLLAIIDKENRKYLSARSYTNADFFTALVNISDALSKLKGE